MDKQELEKAIENGESVWLATEYGIKELKKLKLKDGLLIYYNEDYKFNHTVEENYFDDLYKSQAEAEHYLHHANITRTETLPFVTWEEFKKQKKIRFSGFEGNNYALQYVDSDNMIYLYDCWKNSCEDEEWEATEENFYKAYDECVRLFKGEE